MENKVLYYSEKNHVDHLNAVLSRQKISDELLLDAATIALDRQFTTVLRLLLRHTRSAPSHLCSMLCRAARRGLVESVRELIAADRDIVARDINGATPLCEAIGGGHVEVVRALLQLKSNPNKMADCIQQTPLQLALTLQHIEIATQLLLAKSDPCLIDKDRLTPLGFIATQENSSQFVQLLTSAKACINHGKQLENDYWTTPLELALQEKRTKTAEALLTAKCDPSQGFPLDMALAAGLTDIAIEIVSAKSSLQRRKNGSTPLVMAIEKQNQNLVWAMIESGCDVNMESSSGASPLLVAVKQNLKHVVQHLILSKASVADPHTESTERHGLKRGQVVQESPLLAASTAGSIGIVSMLLETTCSAEQPCTQNHHVSFKEAAKNGHVVVALALLAHGSAGTGRGSEASTLQLLKAADCDLNSSSLRVFRRKLEQKHQQCNPAMFLAACRNARNPTTKTEANGTAALCLAVLCAYRGHIECVEAALRSIRKLVTNSVDVGKKLRSYGAEQVVIDCMQQHTDHVGIQRWGCAALASILNEFEDSFAETAVEVVIGALRMHADSAAVVVWAIVALRKLAQSLSSIFYCCRAGIFHLLVEALEQHIDNSLLIVQVCGLTADLVTARPQLGMTVIEAGGLEAVRRVISQHAHLGGDESVLTQARAVENAISNAHCSKTH